MLRWECALPFRAPDSALPPTCLPPGVKQAVLTMLMDCKGSVPSFLDPTHKVATAVSTSQLATASHARPHSPHCPAHACSLYVSSSL